MRVAITLNSVMNTQEKDRLFDLLLELKKTIIQPVVVLSYWDELADELSSLGILPLIFELEKVDCLAVRKQLIFDFGRFLRHINAEVLLSFGGDRLSQLQAARLIGVPMLVEGPDDILQFRQIIFSSVHYAFGKVFVYSEIVRDEIYRRLDGLTFELLVLPAIGSGNNQAAEEWANTLLMLRKTHEGYSRAVGYRHVSIANPLLGSPELELCSRIPAYPDMEWPKFAEGIETAVLDTSPVRANLCLLNDRLAGIRLMFLIHRRQACICAAREASVKIVMRSYVNPDLELREVDVPLNKIYPLRWTKVPFEPLFVHVAEDFIVDLSISEQIKYLLEVRVFLQTQDGKYTVLQSAD